MQMMTNLVNSFLLLISLINSISNARRVKNHFNVIKLLFVDSLLSQDLRTLIFTPVYFPFYFVGFSLLFELKIHFPCAKTVPSETLPTDCYQLAHLQWCEKLVSVLSCN